MKLSPSTCFAGGIDFYPTNGYHYYHPFTLGFAHTILEGGNFRVTPAVGDADPAGRLKNPLPFSHDRETASPGYYSVYLPSIGCLTGTTKTGTARRCIMNTPTCFCMCLCAAILGYGGALTAT